MQLNIRIASKCSEITTKRWFGAMRKDVCVKKNEAVLKGAQRRDTPVTQGATEDMDGPMRNRKSLSEEKP